MANPFFPYDPFGSMFDPARMAEFNDMVEKAANGGFSFKRDGLGVPLAKVCESKQELAAWFRSFSRACKAVA
jgi:hypothetical protein